MFQMGKMYLLRSPVYADGGNQAKQPTDGRGPNTHLILPAAVQEADPFHEHTLCTSALIKIRMVLLTCGFTHYARVQPKSTAYKCFQGRSKALQARPPQKRTEATGCQFISLICNPSLSRQGTPGGPRMIPADRRNARRKQALDWFKERNLRNTCPEKECNHCFQNACSRVYKCVYRNPL